MARDSEAVALWKINLEFEFPLSPWGEKMGIEEHISREENNPDPTGGKNFKEFLSLCKNLWVYPRLRSRKSVLFGGKFTVICIRPLNTALIR